MKKKIVFKWLSIFLLFAIGIGVGVYFMTRSKSYEYGLFHEGLVVASKDGKHGYLNKNGETVIKFTFDYAESFSNEVAVVKKESSFFLINKEGNFVTKQSFEALNNQKDEGIVVFKKNNKYGLLSPKGNVIKDAIYDAITPFSEGMASFKLDTKVGLINKEGKVVAEAKYDNAEPFINGFAVVYQDGKYGYVDKKGELVVSVKYDYAADFHDGYAIVFTKEEGSLIYSILDNKGKVVHTGYDLILRTQNRFIVCKDEVYSIMAASGKKIELSSNYDNVLGISQSQGRYAKYLLAYDREDKMTYLLDEKGEEIFEVVFDGLNSQVRLDSHNLEVYNIKYSGKKVTITDAKDKVFNFKVNHLNEPVVIYNNLIKIKDGDAWGLVNFDGKTVVDFKYDSIANYTDGYVVVEKDNKFGVLDLKGNIVIPLKYDSLGFLLF